MDKRIAEWGALCRIAKARGETLPPFPLNAAERTALEKCADKPQRYFDQRRIFDTLQDAGLIKLSKGLCTPTESGLALIGRGGE
ncbi:hypothetical protein [Acetobacter sp. DsW_063]|uniref:hypothetical protein n=1 Tax=Acetobacter sp. DsW_063 TaxID=1514894 RepID=UPI000A3A915B|nr:hypothetical protein [Acetobacter sp. DsW_063]OUJ16388.1 hypothetical protein HK28_00175 [Acetobacter sp. DsW_063]